MNCPNCIGNKYQEFETIRNQGKFKLQYDSVWSNRESKIEKCTECKCIWYKNNQILDRIFSVTKDKLDEVIQWETENYKVSEKIIETLNIIGETPNYQYYNRYNQVEYPAKCEFIDGTNNSLCLIRIQLLPPALRIYNYCEQIRKIEDVVAVYRSKYALKKSIRELTIKAREIKNGFAPTVVKNDQSKYYILNGRTNFLKIEDVVGSNVEICKDHPQEKEMTYNHIEIKPTYIFIKLNPNE